MRITFSVVHRLRVEPLLQVIDILLQIGVLLEGRLDFIDGVKNRRVILAAKFVADLRQGEVGQFPGKVHGNLTGNNDLLDPLLSQDVTLGNIVETGDLLLNLGDGDGGLLLLP